MIDGNPLALAVNLEPDAALFQWARQPGRAGCCTCPPRRPTLSAQRHRLCHQTALHEDIIDPEDPGLPDQLYGWCKLTGERLAALARAEGVPVSVVRPFSGYAEDQSSDYPFPSLAARARNREDPFAIWGTGKQVRDWIHVDDICAAILAMVREGIDGPVNLGTGRPVSMRELAGMMCDAAGYEPEFKPLPEMPAGVAYRVADVTRMREFHTPRIPWRRASGGR